MTGVVVVWVVGRPRGIAPTGWTASEGGYEEMRGGTRWVRNELGLMGGIRAIGRSGIPERMERWIAC